MEVRYSVYDLLSKADCLADIDQLVDSIKTHHPQPYAFITERAFDAHVEGCKAQLTDSVPRGAFSWMCNSIVAKVGCLHTYVWPRNLKFSSDLFFPACVRYVGSKLYVVEQDTLQPQLQPGMEVLEVNGVKAAALKKNIAAHLSADGYNHSFTDALIFQNFGYFSAFELGFPAQYRVLVKSADGPKEILLQPLPASSANGPPAPVENLQFRIDTSQNMAVITIKSFVYYDEQLPVFKAFTDNCFREIEQQKIKNVVIDLRGNGGGDPYCANHLLQYIADKPVRYYKPGSTEHYRDLEQEIAPFPNAYKGRLIVLVDGLGGSTTGHFCALLKYHDIGTFVGRETGATYSCNAHTIQFPLAHFGYHCSVATHTYQVDVTGFAKERGVVPHHVVEIRLEDVLAGRDAVMEKVLELLEED